MKVLLVCNGFPPSGQWGTEYYAHGLAKGLVSRGCEVGVLYPVRDRTRPRFDILREERSDMTVFELVNGGDPRKRFGDSYRCEGVEAAFARLLEEEQPDVVHFLHVLWGLSVRLPEIARRHGARTILTPTDLGLICHRGQLFDDKSKACEGPTDAAKCARCVREPSVWDLPPLQRTARKIAVRGVAMLGGLGRVVVTSDLERRRECILEAVQYVDHWILPTRALEQKLREFGIPMNSSTQLSYGIAEELYRQPRIAHPGEGTRFVYMSQYMPHKGLEILLEASRLLEMRLPESVQPWSVQLHGNGTGDRHRRYAPAMLAQLSRRVRDCGPFEPLSAPHVLAATDCVLVPSRWMENAPLTILQARAAGVPVIASDVAGVAEVLEHGVHGLLFPAGDASALADAMSKVIRGEFKSAQRDPLVLHDTHLDEVEAIYGAQPFVMQPESPARAGVAAS
ncbi:MAG: glycosyltransferase involved in cell wall biosynthesis [Candidatus Paceibacteria bacterium]